MRLPSAASELKEAVDGPDGFVLEAPFTSMREEVSTFKIAKVFNYFINVDKLIIDSDLSFDNEHWIKDVKTPLFILHSEDDGVIPFELGRKLYEIALKHSVKVKFYPFARKCGFGHDNIYKCDTLSSIMGEIVSIVHEHK